MKALFLLLIVFSVAFAYEWEPANDGTPVSWPPTMLTPQFMINNNGTPDCSQEFLAVVNSHNTWSNVLTATLAWIYNGTTNRMPAAPWLSISDGYNVVGWYESWLMDPGIIAVCITWYEPSTGDITECDQAFNGMSFTWGTYGESDRMDIQNIDTHETGHTLLLLDLYDTPSSEITMYGYASEGETKKRTLEPDDEAGISFLYPGTPTEVKIVSLTAEAVQRGNIIRWEAQESSSHVGYNIYRRSYSGTFTRARPGNQGFIRINPQLITGRGEYEYLDTSAEPGTMQYLLADVDVNGHESYHGPLNCDSLSRPVAFSLSVAPNPADTVVRLRYSVSDTLIPGTNPILKILDLSGKLVDVLPLAAGAGDGEVMWDTGRVSPGLYSAVLASGEQRVIKRIVVAH